MTDTEMQAKFEAWANSSPVEYCLLPSKWDNGSAYRIERTQHAFEGFKAGIEAAHLAAPASEPYPCRLCDGTGLLGLYAKKCHICNGTGRSAAPQGEGK